MAIDAVTWLRCLTFLLPHRYHLLMSPSFSLAMDSADPKSIHSIFIWSGILIGLLLLAFAAYSYLKRWMNQTDEPGSVGFTLSDLRELHRQGKMSDGEFEQTKAMMLGSAKKMASQMPPVLPRRPIKPPADQGRTSPPLT